MENDIIKDNWHSLPLKDVLRKFDTDEQKGLSDKEVSKRRDKYGLNTITKKKGVPAWVRFLAQFHQPLIYILLISTIITLFLEEWIDASVIFSVVFINAIVGFLQESKALKELESLSKSMTASATVLRNEEIHNIDSTQLVPGDIVIIVSGEKNTADMRIINSRDLQVNESPLTGESVPVQKNIQLLDNKTPLAERSNMLYASTFVTYGRGKAVVVSTGDNTEVGKISELISTAENLETPLTIKISHFSRYLLYIILCLSALTFIMGILKGESVAQMFMTAIAFAVGAIPEGLPAVVTITLAIGVARMAKRRAIIRKLPAVETLGSTKIICSDKTGTLTENQMTVREIFCGNETFKVTGAGYSFKGKIKNHSGKSEPGSSIALKECLTAGLLCNDSRIIETETNNKLEGDPTEGALVVSARKGENLFEGGLPKLKRKDSIPFESEYQYMATSHVVPGGEDIIYLKGSVERILSKCVDKLDRTGKIIPFNKDDIYKKSEVIASKGLRVIAFARRTIEKNKNTIEHNDITESMTFIGMQAMIDPPRKEAIEAVEKCHSAGIIVKMITGDHALTAKTISMQLKIKSNLNDKNEQIEVLQGKDIENINDKDLTRLVNKVSVFARVTPQQKIRLVRAFQSSGEIVAMTGDGVNDAPALSQANIGIAMGQTGTEVAKEAADMILTDDNFASIEAAVEEGRGVFDNLRKFFVWTLPTNLGEALAIMIAVFGGTILPVAPVQLLWVNMTTSLFLGMTLAFEPKEKDLMQRAPSEPSTPIMTKDLIQRTVLVGIILAIGVFSLFYYEKNRGLSIEEARTTAVGVLVFGELFYLFNCRSLSYSVFHLGFFSNLWLILGVIAMIILQMLFTYVGFFNMFFDSAPISLNMWLRVLLVGVFIYIVVEAEKFLRSRKDKKKF